MPYHSYYSNGKWVLKNTETGQIRHFDSKESMEKTARVSEAYSHGWVPSHSRRGTRGVRGYQR